ncbi:hypothetical protein A0H76_1639 [Hepatospora eriocheir]|uniref:Uncharacterized protein n=1 Tax=Hepatospora eriocheir TaxID=1081669 RepID=A0A1X0Q960_9MICR|nr:hypothetical protein HERIO_1760 [Hepatospora eriocheir]ORE00304.1 hypothetical protein A0H76_1639 [Hepatospora eriocheir]
MFFFFKLSPNLIFDGSEYKEQEETGDKLIIKQFNNKSNTKLCKRKDGTWFIKNGNVNLELKNTNTSKLRVINQSKSNSKVYIEGEVNKKWFIQKI